MQLPTSPEDTDRKKVAVFSPFRVLERSLRLFLPLSRIPRRVPCAPATALIGGAMPAGDCQAQETESGSEEYCSRLFPPQRQTRPV